MFWASAGWVLYLGGGGVLLSRWVDQWFHVKRSYLGWAMAAGLGAGVALLARRGSEPAEVAAAIIMLPVLAALAAVDMGERRLPDRLTAMAALGAVAGLAHLLVVERDAIVQRLGQVLLGVVLSAGIHGVLVLVSAGRGMGLGDLKLAPSLAVVPIWLGWEQWALGVAIPFLLGGMWGLVLILKGEGRRATMPFGPLMIAGWYLAVLSG